MRRACRALVCVVIVLAALCAPADAATTNGQLAAVADGRLLTFNADGSGLRSYPVADAAQITELAFSPGGNRLAFVKAGELSVLDLASGRVLTLTTGERDAQPGLGAGRDDDRVPARPLALRVPADGRHAATGRRRGSPTARATSSGCRTPGTSRPSSTACCCSRGSTCRPR